jgi:hypothetical protein
MSLAPIVGQILPKASVALAVTCIKYVGVICSTNEIPGFEVCCWKTKTPDTAREMGSQASHVLMMPSTTIAQWINEFPRGSTRGRLAGYQAVLWVRHGFEIHLSVPLRPKDPPLPWRPPQV